MIPILSLFLMEHIIKKYDDLLENDLSVTGGILLHGKN